MIDGNTLKELGFDEGRALGAALKVANRLIDDGYTVDEVREQLEQVLDAPDAWVDDSVWGRTARLLHMAQPRTTGIDPVPLRAEPAPLTVWGRELIDDDSFQQINDARRLPPTLRVALMPDAHIGYGIPIGGVAALEGALAPYMVGVDIGCRMHATVFDRNPIHLKQAAALYEGLLLENTWFGRSAPPPSRRLDHPILDDPRWELLPPPLRRLKDQAAEQLGTSGGGNHFVEWVRLDVMEDNPLGIPLGGYIALVSHSGSRGVGYKIADYYSRLAQNLCYFLPKEMRRLGYLDHARGDGEAYEIAMNLAGDYARANHEIIHQRVRDALGGTVLGTLQNHHNFAWRVERPDGPPVFIHRKGATPAERGVMGIIPGSMATPGFFVEGACFDAARVLEHPALNTAAHGSGRRLGRKQAQRSLSVERVREMLDQRGVTLLGGGLDEAPDAYKDSRTVIAAQHDLVHVWAEFMPVIVRMASDRGRSMGRPTDDRPQGGGRSRGGRKKRNKRRR